MKTADAATLSILAAGQYAVIECFQIYLPHSGNSYYFTSWDVPVSRGGITYQTGLTIKRGPVIQKVGLEVQTCDLEISPQPDNPAGAILIDGFPFLVACRNGELDAARFTMSKLFLNNAVAQNPALVPWFQGRINQVDAGRVTAKITVASNLELLNVSMPRNVFQVGCLHQLYDTGCQVRKSDFTTTGTVTGAQSPTIFTITSTVTSGNFSGGKPITDHAFDLGIITMTSGVNNGDSRVVKTSLLSSGQISVIFPWPAAATVGDTFTVSAGCDKLQSTCTNKFQDPANPANPTGNLRHFRGYPFIPQPETLYDGGTDLPYHQVAPFDNTPGSNQGAPGHGGRYQP